MSGFLETQRSFVNAWESDENHHMNIQFYWKRFGDAAPIFFHLAAAKRQDWTDRHVRYHDELMMGTNVIVRSAKTIGGLGLVHELINGNTGAVSATAVDLYPNPIGGTTAALESVPDLARPRSLQSQVLQTVDTVGIIERGQGVMSHRSIVSPMECDPNGKLLDQFYISRFSDAASHLWHHLGVTRAWMHDNRLGTVAVEMKASRHKLIPVGTMLEVVSWLEAIGNKTFSFRHQVSDMESGDPLFSGAVTALLLDLDARKAVPLPSGMRDEFERRMS